MMKVTAKPTWQWSSKTVSSPYRLPASIVRVSSPLRQALLPRNLEVAFSLSYRR